MDENSKRAIEKLMFKLATGVISNESNLYDIIKEYNLNDHLEFFVSESYDEKKPYSVILEICQMGGCTTSSVEFETLTEALLYCATKTLLGHKIGYHGLCSECSADYHESII